MSSFTRSRIGLISGTAVVFALGAAAACSSSSGGPVAPPASEPELTNEAGLPEPLPDGATPAFLGTAGACTPLTDVTTATMLTLDVAWPGTASTAMSPATPQPQLYIWLLSHYTVTGNAISGNTWTCGDETPPFTLTALGDSTQGESSGQTATLQITFKNEVWDAIMQHMNGGNGNPSTGSIGGWNIGSSFQVNPATSVLGLKPTSTYANPSTEWPKSESLISPSDYSDDDNDGHPGITATPLGTSGTSTPYVLPVTNLTSPPSPPAQALFVTTRTQLSLYGKSTSCMAGEGTATVTLLNNHVIGCEILGYDVDAGPDADTTELCDNGVPSGAQTEFLDTNTTQYTVMSGTYQTVQLQAGDGATATCEDVRNAFPTPTTM